MTFSLDECKQFAGNLNDLSSEYMVTRHKSALDTKINDLCLKMGFLQESGQKVDELYKEFEAKIASTTKDSKELDKLRTYANRLVELGKQFYHVSQHR